MGHALPAQARAGRLEHQPHRDVPAPQRRHLLLGQDPGVRVREHAALDRDAAGLDQVLRRAAEAAALEPLAMRAVGDLGLVAEAEERFDAADGDAAPHHRRHLVDDPPAFEKPDAIGDIGCAQQVVGHHQHRGAAGADGAQQPVEICRRPRIEARRRLVEQ